MAKLLSDRAKIIPLLGVVLVIAVGAALVIVLTPGSPGATSRTSSAPTAVSPQAGGKGGTVKVTIKNYTYQPATLRVAAGTTIAWTNEDGTDHTSTADNGGFSGGASFDTGTINQGQTKTATLSKPGSYPYHCSFHAFMHGTIIVK